MDMGSPMSASSLTCAAVDGWLMALTTSFWVTTSVAPWFVFKSGCWRFFDDLAQVLAFELGRIDERFEHDVVKGIGSLLSFGEDDREVRGRHRFKEPNLPRFPRRVE